MITGPAGMNNNHATGKHGEYVPAECLRRGRKRIASVLIALSVSLVAGCSHQDFGAPVTAPITDRIDGGKPFIDKRASDEALARAHRLAKVLAEWKVETQEPSTDYSIGGDDVLEIGVLNLDEPGKESKLVRTVASDGTISIPWTGRIAVAGLNVQGVEKAVAGALGGRYIKNPQVTCLLTTFRSKSVILTGAVTKPGIYYMNKNSSTLLEVLAKADGLDAGAGDELLIIRGGGLVETNVAVQAEGQDNTAAKPQNLVSIDLKQLIDAGDLRLNLPVKPGDIVTVMPKSRDYVYVLGYVQRPGAVEMTKDKPIGALQAVAMAGGLGSTARAENSSLVRQTPEGQKVFPVDLTKIARGTRPELYLEPGDTLVVGSSFIARLSEFVRPSLSTGVSYTPVP